MEDIYPALEKFAKKVKLGELKRYKDEAAGARWRIELALQQDEALQDDLSNALKYIAAIFYLRGYQDSETHRSQQEKPHREHLEHSGLRTAIAAMYRKEEGTAVKALLHEYVGSDIKLANLMEAEVIASICERLEERQVRAIFLIEDRREEYGPRGRSWTREPLIGAARETIRRFIKRLRSDERASTRRRRFLLRDDADNKS